MTILRRAKILSSIHSTSQPKQKRRSDCCGRIREEDCVHIWCLCTFNWVLFCYFFRKEKLRIYFQYPLTLARIQDNVLLYCFVGAFVARNLYKKLWIEEDYRQPINTNLKTSNKKTDHSRKVFSLYHLIDINDVYYMSSDLCTAHTIGYLFRVSLLASFIGCGDSGEDMSHFICQQKKSTLNLLCPTSNVL